ncbi:GNAT family N-acetyltransferase [Paenibacillus rhizovicinus]|uniref:GNAT family N-acetyltransferase n=1 Tax=Paenibacillus rhizovicinus TaxID=2704463 RepID=A0A6C0P1I5_9BACL|nr:GNAT family N-acetyltransferase [Paenibacillus rhizovicinus]QHW32317.1 GNAT family N-acetyltransferase [Paenibacillus rhizovicinus]
MLIVKRLDPAACMPYETLTYHYARSLLYREDGGRTSFAVGAEWTEWSEGTSKAKAVGLVVIHFREDGGNAEVVSVFVKAAYRRQGIGTALLREAERILRDMPCERLSFTYYSGKAITPAVEAFLHREGWSEPVSEGKVYQTDKRIADAAWIRKTAMPKGMRSFYWHEIGPEEKARLLEAEGSLYPAFLSPFKSKLPAEESNSLGLRLHGETVGWCMTYRIADDTVLYDSVYVTPELRLSGCAFMLIAQSISIQLERGIPKAIFAVNNEAPFMRKMLDRWLMPYATGVSERRAAYKTIMTTRGQAHGGSIG